MPRGALVGRAMRRLPLALVALMLSVGPAASHAILIESTPDLRLVPPGAVRVTLRFNSRIDAQRSKLELRRDGKVQAVPLSPGAEDTLVAQLALLPGAWVLRWQVLAVDGHITRGDVPVMVAGR